MPESGTSPPRRPRASDDAALPRLSVRLSFGSLRIGPGKAALLEEINRHGSISAAGRALKMSYRRAWELVEDLNRGMGSPVVEAAAGGANGGGARLTAVGESIVRQYRAIEAEARAAAAERLAALARLRRNRTP